MSVSDWIASNWIEIFGALSGIIYVFLEIRQNIWLWPVGIVTSAVYIVVFFTSKFYADMSLQGYYLVMSCIGWYWWAQGAGHGAQGEGHRAQGTGHRAQGSGHGAQGTGHRAQGEEHGAQGAGHRAQGEEHRAQGTGHRAQGEGHGGLQVTRLRPLTGLVLAAVFILSYTGIWFILSRFTDSPVPGWDSFITSLSAIATWMLARKIYEHWYLWIAVNAASVMIFVARGLYPTVILYAVYLVMSFAGLKVWKRSISA